MPPGLESRFFCWAIGLQSGDNFTDTPKEEERRCCSCQEIRNRLSQENSKDFIREKVE